MLLEEVKPGPEHINFGGHVDNEEIYRWFNQARLKLFERFGEAVDVFPSFPYVKCELQFKREIDASGPLSIATHIGHIGNKSFVISQRMEQGGALCAECNTTVVHMPEGRAVLIEGAMREALEALR